MILAIKSSFTLGVATATLHCTRDPPAATTWPPAGALNFTPNNLLLFIPNNEEDCTAPPPTARATSRDPCPNKPVDTATDLVAIAAAISISPSFPAPTT
jgi:hypothetical protein